MFSFLPRDVKLFFCCRRLFADARVESNDEKIPTRTQRAKTNRLAGENLFRRLTKTITFFSFALTVGRSDTVAIGHNIHIDGIARRLCVRPKQLRFGFVFFSALVIILLFLSQCFFTFFYENSYIMTIDVFRTSIS